GKGGEQRAAPCSRGVGEGVHGFSFCYLIPVVAMPLTRYFCPARKKPKTGPSATTDMANSGPQEVWELESTKVRSATGTVYISGLVRKINWLKKSFQVQMKVKIAVVAKAGIDSGRMIRQKMRTCPHPSIRAASSRSLGSPRMNCTIRKM